METRTLESLILKHFDFLRKDYGFNYDKSLHCYCKDKLKIKVQHENGELNLTFIIKEKSMNFIDLMSKVLQKKFSYPDYFSSWVLSMGDVDSRLAYDAKLIKEHTQAIFAV